MAEGFIQKMISILRSKNVKKNTKQQIIEKNTYASNYPNSTIDFPMFPMIQKISARTIGMDLVAVQPMTAPSGILHYADLPGAILEPTKTYIEQKIEDFDY